MPRSGTILRLLLSAFFILFIRQSLFGAGGIIGNAGIKGVYSLVGDEDNVVLWPFLQLGYDWNYVKIQGEYTLYPHEPLSLFINQEISLPNFSYKNLILSLSNLTYQYVLIHDFRAGITIRPIKEFNLEGYAGFGMGNSDYLSIKGGAGVSLYLGRFSFLGKYNYDKTEFLYDKFRRPIDVNVKTVSHSLYSEFSVEIIPEASMELGYTYFNIAGELFNTTFDKHTFRLGATGVPIDPLSITGGISYGFDSNDYNICEIDAGLTYEVNTHLEFSLLYNFSYLDYGGAEKTQYKKIRKGLISYTFDTYYSHFFITGVTFKI